MTQPQSACTCRVECLNLVEPQRHVVIYGSCHQGPISQEQYDAVVAALGRSRNRAKNAWRDPATIRGICEDIVADCDATLAL